MSDILSFIVMGGKLLLQEQSGHTGTAREIHGGAVEAGSELRRWLEERGFLSHQPNQAETGRE